MNRPSVRPPGCASYTLSLPGTAARPFVRPSIEKIRQTATDRPNELASERRMNTGPEVGLSCYMHERLSVRPPSRRTSTSHITSIGRLISLGPFGKASSLTRKPLSLCMWRQHASAAGPRNIHTHSLSGREGARERERAETEVKDIYIYIQYQQLLFNALIAVWDRGSGLSSPYLFQLLMQSKQM